MSVTVDKIIAQLILLFNFTCHNTLVTSLGSDDDLEYYVRECGSILGVTSKLAPEHKNAKHILEHIFTQLVEFKKFNQVRKILRCVLYIFMVLVIMCTFLGTSITNYTRRQITKDFQNIVSFNECLCFCIKLNNK